MVMTGSTVSIDWGRAQLALRAEVERVARLLRSGIDPARPALGEWTVAEVAMHLSQAWLAVPGMAQEDLAPVYDVIPSAKERASLLRNLWELGDLTKLGVQSDPERDLAVLADRIQSRAAAYFAAMHGLAGDLRAWLVEGTAVPLAALTCHLLNETIVHGWDIAHATRQRWPIEPSHAALVIEGFILPVFQALDPREMVDQQRAAGVRATYEFRLRGGQRYIFAFHDGALTVEGPLAAAVKGIDCHISADAAEMLLVAWGRRSQWPAIAAGKITAWGRKPWLGPKFRSLVRNP
ncbi:MAG: maleylpyruvate isomerase N-terminal domain-containing protein [Acidimicrobiales bacterium]